MEKLTPKRDELRKFGLSVGAVIGILFGLLFPWLFSKPLPYWPWYLATPLISLGLIWPRALKWPFRIWMTLGKGLNWLNTRILLFILFFGVFTPIAFFLRLFNKVPLNRHKNNRSHTYRILAKDLSTNNMERPY